MARLPNGMISLALVLVAVRATGSYAEGGGLADRLQCRDDGGEPELEPCRRSLEIRVTLGVTAIGRGVALAVMGRSPPGPARGIVVMTCLSAVIGAVQPPLGSVVRTLWGQTFPQDPQRTTAFASEPVAVDLVSIVGPRHGDGGDRP